MLAVRELAWWPLAPLLMAQGLYVRLATTRLPPAEGQSGSAGTGRRLLRLTGLGDSIIAGIGVPTGPDSLVGQVAARLAERSGRAIEWRAVGQSGATVEVILRQLAQQAVTASPEVLLVSTGVNDAVAGTNPAVFRQGLHALVDVLTADAGPAIVLAGIPPMASFPALPRPLATLLGRRAAVLTATAAQVAGCRGLRLVAFPATLRRDAFARDGFHPGPEACRDWSHWIVDSLAGGPAGLALGLGPRGAGVERRAPPLLSSPP